MSGRRFTADRLIPLLLTLLAFGLRFATITTQPLSGDEAMHLQRLSFLEMVNLDLAFNPPLFRLLVRLCTMVSPTPLAARLIPLLAGVATVPLLFLVARRHFSLSAASLAGLLLAVHPWHIRHSQTVRAYTLLTLMWLLSVAHTWSATSRPPGSPSRTTIIRHLAIALLLLSTHYLGFVMLSLEIACLLVHGKWRHGLPLVALVTCAALAIGPLLGLAAGEKFRVTASLYTSGLPFLLTELITMATPGGLSLLAVWLLVALGGLDMELRVPACLAGGWLATVPLLGLAMPIELRYALPALPLVLLLAGRGAATLLNSSRLSRRLAAVAVICLATAGIAYLLPTYYRAPLDPGTALASHRDLVHDAASVSVLVERFRETASSRQGTSLVLVSRGPTEHQVLLSLGGGSYPEVSATGSGLSARSYRGIDFLLLVHDSPAPPEQPCPQWPELPFSLLFESPLACDLPGTCEAAHSSGKYTLLSCPRRPHRGPRRVRR